MFLIRLLSVILVPMSLAIAYSPCQTVTDLCASILLTLAYIAYRPMDLATIVNESKYLMIKVVMFVLFIRCFMWRSFYNTSLYPILIIFLIVNHIWNNHQNKKPRVGHTCTGRTVVKTNGIYHFVD